MKSAGITQSLVNFAIYQLGWFACVLGAAAGWGNLGAACALALVLLHLVLAAKPNEEWPLLLAALSLGLVVDSLHAEFGILEFNGQVGALAPLWVLALWVQFGTALHYSLRWLSGRYLLAGLMGAVGGPMAFLGGERLGAAVFGEPRALSLAVLGFSWGIALPFLVYVADRLGGAGSYRLPGRPVRSPRLSAIRLATAPVETPVSRSSSLQVKRHG